MVSTSSTHAVWFLLQTLLHRTNRISTVREKRSHVPILPHERFYRRILMYLRQQLRKPSWTTPPGSLNSSSSGNGCTTPRHSHNILGLQPATGNLQNTAWCNRYEPAMGQETDLSRIWIQTLSIEMARGRLRQMTRYDHHIAKSNWQCNLRRVELRKKPNIRLVLLCSRRKARRCRRFVQKSTPAMACREYTWFEAISMAGYRYVTFLGYDRTF